MISLANLRFVTCTVAVITPFVAGCSPERPKLKIIVPNCFTGMVEIKQSSAPTGSPIRDETGAKVYRIPITGTLAVRSLQPFTTWHQLIVQYEDGSSIPIEREAPPTAVAVRDIDFINSNTIRYRIDKSRK